MIAEIARMDEDEVLTSAEISAMRAHVAERLDLLGGLPWQEQAAHSADVFDEAQVVMAAADRYGRLRHALNAIRFGSRFSPESRAA